MTSSSPGPREDPNYELRRLRARVKELEKVLADAPQPSRIREDLIYQVWWQDRERVLALVPVNEETP